MTPRHLVLHGLAIKKHGTPTDIAALTVLSEEETRLQLAALAASGRAIASEGRFLLSPLAAVALECDYSRHYASVRADSDFMRGYEAFERINIQLKAVITDWQSMDISGRRLPNDHQNAAYDDAIIDRLGDIDDRVSSILTALGAAVPRLTDYYRDRLLRALEKAEDGNIEWVSDVRIESYHTIWFELHEDLLRIVGRKRQE
jgi:hypothetical protein